MHCWSRRSAAIAVALVLGLAARSAAQTDAVTRLEPYRDPASRLVGAALAVMGYVVADVSQRLGR